MEWSDLIVPPICDTFANEPIAIRPAPLPAHSTLPITPHSFQSHHQRSIDLANRNTAGVVLHSLSAINPVTGREFVTSRSTTPFGSLDREFLRLRVDKN